MARLALTKYGRREWLAATAVAAVGCAALGVAAQRMGWPFLIPVAVIVPVWMWVLWFFRDPDRTPPAEEGVFLSAADGTVADITPVGPDSDLGRDGVKIGVFMSVFSVHVNRAACHGRVQSIVHHDGAFMDVRKPEAAFANESTTIRLSCPRGGREYPVILRQVAGLIARRIVTDLRPGQQVRAGERIGMIKFGSRLELLVPRELIGEVRVAVGDKAVAGQTILIAAAKGTGHEKPAEK